MLSKPFDVGNFFIDLENMQIYGIMKSKHLSGTFQERHAEKWLHFLKF